MGNRKHSIFIGFKHFILGLSVIFIFTSTQAQVAVGIHSGFGYQQFAGMSGVNFGANVEVQIFKKSFIEFGASALLSRGNPNIDLKDFAGNYYIGTEFVDNEDYQANYKGFKSSMADQAYIKLLFSQEIISKGKHRLNIGFGGYFTKVQMNVVHTTLPVTYIEEPLNFVIETNILIPIYHKFITTSWTANASYHYNFTDNFRLRVDPFYNYMRKWNGFMGVNVGVMVGI